MPFAMVPTITPYGSVKTMLLLNAGVRSQKHESPSPKGRPWQYTICTAAWKRYFASALGVFRIRRSRTRGRRFGDFAFLTWGPLQIGGCGPPCHEQVWQLCPVSGVRGPGRYSATSSLAVRTLCPMVMVDSGPFGRLFYI